jgi:hypothetical protein
VTCAFGRILHQVPFPVFSTAGHVVTHNPVAPEVRDGVLRLFAAPDDADEGAGTQLPVCETPPSAPRQVASEPSAGHGDHPGRAS